MMKKYLVLLLAFIPAFLFAQEEDENNDEKYLAGAVPTVDGKVVFSKTFDVPNLSEGQIYDAMIKWCEARFQTNEKKKNWGRVLYSNKEKGQIACNGNEYIVFTDKALSLDRTKIDYRLTMFVEPGKCDITINKISFDYEQRELPAEEWITDKYALNKSQTKLSFGIAKFRRKTVDLMDNLFDEAQKALGISALATVPAAKTVAASPVNPTPAISPSAGNAANAQSSMPGYREITPEQIPADAIKSTSGNTVGFAINYKDVFNTVMVKAGWGGLGTLLDRPVVFCSLAPEQANGQTGKAETYALKFYGNNQTEPWMIIECKKLNNQAVQVGEATMIAGEILKVWIK